jgi:glycosyltransferase involved in cell wall biosynthesis
MRIAIITAGGAGMFCGSCMQDNTLARSLRLAGADALLLPTYTPVRVDEDDVSGSRVFLGGINVYLDSKLPGWRLLPRSMKRWLDRPGLVKCLSKLSSSTNASNLGPLTIDLLRGSHGPQKKEIEELIQYLCDDLRPDVILFSNALLSGIVPELRRRFAGKIVCLLQGDDIFLDGLPEPWKSKAIALVAENAAHFDGLLTHSRYYSAFMHAYLHLPSDGFRNVPLSIEQPPAAKTLNSADGPASDAHSARLSVGYFARICPEKGAFRFLEAAERVLVQRPDLQFVIGGFLPEQHRKSFELRLQALQNAGGDRIKWAGSPATREEKFELLRSFDWLCVPTEYREPKGLYVLEAALVGVPSLVPSHGAFPERIAALGSGQLYDPTMPGSLEAALMDLRKPPAENRHASLEQRCLSVHGMKETGHQVLDAIRSL